MFIIRLQNTFNLQERVVETSEKPFTMEQLVKHYRDKKTSNERWLKVYEVVNDAGEREELEMAVFEMDYLYKFI